MRPNNKAIGPFRAWVTKGLAARLAKGHFHHDAVARQHVDRLSADRKVAGISVFEHTLENRPYLV